MIRKRKLVRPIFDVGIKIRNGREAVEAALVTTTAAWIQVTGTKATVTAPVAFRTIVWAHPPILRVMPKLDELERLDGGTCMEAETYVVPKIPRTARKFRPHITINCQIDYHLPKPDIPFSSHTAHLDLHLHIHDDSATLDMDIA